MDQADVTRQMTRVLLASDGWLPTDVDQPVEIWVNKGGAKKCVLNNRNNKIRCWDAISWSQWDLPQDWWLIYQWIKIHSSS